MEDEIYYRYKIRYEYYEHINIEILTYKVKKHTPLGVWISQGIYDCHFILNNSRKKFAYPDKATALESFKLRKQRQIELLTEQLSDAKTALYMVENKTADVLE